MKPSKDTREYLAEIGRKGGKTTGPQKARPPEHYAEMVRKRRAPRRDSSDTHTGLATQETDSHKKHT